MTKTLHRRDMYTGETVALSGLAKITGITVTNLKKLIDQGLPNQLDGDIHLFDSAVATKWIIQYKVDEALPDDENGGRIGIVEAKRRYEVARMLQAELSLAKDREEVANIDDLMLNFTEALVQVRAKLVSTPSRLAGILSHQDEEAVTDLLERDITDTLEILSGYKHEYIGNQSTITEEDSSVNKRSPLPLPIPAPKIKPS